MAEGKSAVLFEKVSKDYVETVAPLIAEMDRHNATCAKNAVKPYKESKYMDGPAVKNVWKRWMSKYRAVKAKYQVTASMSKGQTGLSGDEALPKSANDAITEATEQGWHLFSRFHNQWRLSSRFDECHSSTTLTPPRAGGAGAGGGSGGEGGPHGGQGPDQPTKGGAAAALVGLSRAPAGATEEDDQGETVVVADVCKSSKAPRRQSAVAASAAIAFAIASDTDDAMEVPPPPVLEAESSWDSSMEGQGLVNPTGVGSDEYNERRARHLTRKAAREAVAKPISLKRKASAGGSSEGRKSEVGVIKRESGRDRRLAAQVESQRADSAKECEQMRGKMFGSVMKETTQSKVAALERQTAALVEMEREKAAAAAAIASAQIDQQRLDKLVDIYMRQNPELSPSKAMEKAHDAVDRQRARQQATV